MTREELTARVHRLEPWFHCIDLGQGVKTKTASVADEPPDHPLGTWEIIKKCLPEDLTGKSVLDMGCNAGFYAIEAKRRNAARILGIDAQRHHIRQALFVRRVLGLDIEYRRMSVYDLSPRTVGRFDITLALGLIYHCKHLLLALENLFQVTNEVLILESAVLLTKNAPEVFQHVLDGLPRRLYPLAYVENPLDSKEYVFNWFLPSPACLQALLKGTGFDEVEVFATWGERAVLLCRKRSLYLDSRAPQGLAATIRLEQGPKRCQPGSELLFRVWAQNSGLTKWLAKAKRGAERGAVSLGAHLLKKDEEEIALDYGRAFLPRDVNPGERIFLVIHLQAPKVPGTYRIEFDMVAEHLTWFEDLGSQPLAWEIQVEAAD